MFYLFCHGNVKKSIAIYVEKLQQELTHKILSSLHCDISFLSTYNSFLISFATSSTIFYFPVVSLYWWKELEWTRPWVGTNPSKLRLQSDCRVETHNSSRVVIQNFNYLDHSSIIKYMQRTTSKYLQCIQVTFLSVWQSVVKYIYIYI